MKKLFISQYSKHLPLNVENALNDFVLTILPSLKVIQTTNDTAFCTHSSKLLGLLHMVHHTGSSRQVARKYINFIFQLTEQLMGNYISHSKESKLIK